MKFLRTLLINIAVFLGFGAVLYFAIPVVDSAIQVRKAFFSTPDRRGTLPNYANVDWGPTHFAEFNRLPTDYESFIGWRRRPFSGKTITIEPEMHIRVTPSASPEGNGRSVYFFGGSTMWGTGATDAGTIPAQYQRLAGGKTMNFGESGWTAHHSLNQLIKLYTMGHRPNVVVFYDGYNDISAKCRIGQDFWKHERQERIRQAVAYRATEWGYYAQPIRQFLNLVTSPSAPDASDCDTDPRKAELVAEQLVTDWKIAQMLVQSWGGTFRAYLQPVAYFSKTRVDQLRFREDLRRQFQVMYPLIRKKMQALDWARDISDVLDVDSYVYVDECHLSPNGDELVAARMVADLK